MEKPIEAEIMGAKLLRELAQYEPLEKVKRFMNDCYFDICDNGITVHTSDKIRRLLYRYKHMRPQAAVIAERIYQQKEAVLAKNGITTTDIYMKIWETFNENKYIMPDTRIMPLSKIEHTIYTICEYYGISKADFEGRCRKKKYVTARAVFTHLCIGSVSLAGIGRLMNRDHTTVMNLRDSIKARIPVELDLAVDINIIRNKLEL